MWQRSTLHSDTGAGYGEKNAERLARRHGYRDRLWETRAGTVELRSEAAQRQLFPRLPGAAAASREALTAVVQEAYVHGVSTRSVDDLVKTLGMTGISQEPGQPAVRGDRRQGESLPQPPPEGDWPYLWIDATYLKVRQSGRIVCVAAIVAVGVNSDGRREVLGMAIGPSEAEPFWTDFLHQLARRGCAASSW